MKRLIMSFRVAIEFYLLLIAFTTSMAIAHKPRRVAPSLLILQKEFAVKFRDIRQIKKETKI